MLGCTCLQSIRHAHVPNLLRLRGLGVLFLVGIAIHCLEACRLNPTLTLEYTLSPNLQMRRYVKNLCDTLQNSRHPGAVLDGTPVVTPGEKRSFEEPTPLPGASEKRRKTKTEHGAKPSASRLPVLRHLLVLVK